MTVTFKVTVNWLLVLLVALAFDIGFHHVAAEAVAELFGRRLEEIRGWANDRSTEAAIQGDLGAANGVDHHAGRIRAVPHLEFGFEVERHVTEGRAFHADVAPLSIGHPRHAIRWTDVDIVLAQIVGNHTGDRAGL